MSRGGAILLVCSVAAAALLAVAAHGDPFAERRHERELGYGQVRFDGAGPERWAARYRRARRELAGLRAALRRARRYPVQRLVAQPRTAIALIFGPYTGQALRVSDCETGGSYSTAASNGQYQGLFQLGARERALYGQGATALEQARAAYVYFVTSGRDWSPWTCKP